MDNRPFQPYTPWMNQRIFHAGLALWIGLGLLSGQTVADPPQTVRDLPYVTGGVPSQQLDLYLPKDRSMPHPLVIWIHGGGWTQGNKQGCPICALVNRGYAVASVGYRLSQEAIYPAQIQDCKAAVRWIRAHASEYAIDPKRVGAWGESAGGHLVALLGTTGKIRDFDVGENLDQSSEVECVVDWFGPSDFLHWGTNNAQLDTVESLVSQLLGGTVSTHQDAARSASPIHFVNVDSAPFLIFHGEQDSLVPVQQSKDLDQAMKKAGVESHLVILPHAGHGGSAFFSGENLKEIAGFLDRHLAPQPTSPASGG